MIEMREIKKIYGTGESAVNALRGISLSVKKGESLAIMGKSGSGKSTLLHILGGLDYFDEGQYTFCGKNMKNLREGEIAKLRNSEIGFVMQDFSLVGDKSVLYNTMLPMYFDRTSRKDMKSFAYAALDRVGIADLAKRNVNQLSGGQKQRVAIARAIVKKPKLILADEPTGALDTSTGKEILKLLLTLNQQGHTLIIVTHDKDVAASCGRCIVLADGKILESESVKVATYDALNRENTFSGVGGADKILDRYVEK